jgi:hypothetical protein
VHITVDYRPHPGGAVAGMLEGRARLDNGAVFVVVAQSAERLADQALWAAAAALGRPDTTGMTVHLRRGRG